MNVSDTIYFKIKYAVNNGMGLISTLGLIFIFSSVHYLGAAGVDAIWTNASSGVWSCDANWDTVYPNDQQDTASIVTDTINATSNLTSGTAITITLSENLCPV